LHLHDKGQPVNAVYNIIVSFKKPTKTLIHFVSSMPTFLMFEQVVHIVIQRSQLLNHY